MTVYLNFHGLGEPGANVDADERPYWLSADCFAEILGLIAPAADRVKITFDDGNETDLTVALPLLQKKKLRADFFIPTARIGAKGYLSEANIKALRNARMGIGSHGAAHVRWTDIGDGELDFEICAPLERLSAITGDKVDTVAIPFGAYDRHVLAALKQRRVARVYTSDQGIAPPNSWLVARNSVRSDMPLGTIQALIARANSTAAMAKTFLRQAKRRVA